MAKKKIAEKAEKEMGSFCTLRNATPKLFESSVSLHRARLIQLLSNKWANGTVLHYYFFDQQTDGDNFASWSTSDKEKNVVRRAFEKWKDLGIGLEFEEVSSRTEAEIRIGFLRGDGAWSYIGRDVLDQGADERTMNFGWDLTAPGEEDTALHEIGHTLGFPHEHQNPNAGIVWNEEAVYEALAKPPNNWDRNTTFHNIIEKIQADQVQGSKWDPNSIMHYPFEMGLISKPAHYSEGLKPAGGLSARDKTWIKTFYPPLTNSSYQSLAVAQSVPLEVKEGGQQNFVIKPLATRKYDFATFGKSDSVIVLFEDVNGKLRFRDGDDDSGEDRNARLSAKLYKGRKYVLRVRVHYKEQADSVAVMMW